MLYWLREIAIVSDRVFINSIKKGSYIMEKTLRRTRIISIAIIFLLLLQVGVPLSGLGSPNAYAAIDGDFGFEIINGTATITGYSGLGGEVVIPATVTDGIDNFTVTSIGDRAFSGCVTLTSITIPSGVTSIGWGAFHSCSGLTSVTIPTGVISIGDYSFIQCTSLTNITIPNSVTSIGKNAFDRCRGLLSVTIPNSVTSIGDFAFSGCGRLTSVNIPESVTSIGEGAFGSCSSLTNITIPTSVTNISSKLFYDCSSLANVTIPNSATTIGSSVFTRCSSLTNITIPESVISIGGGAFWGCSGLTSVTIPSGVTRIEESTFYECSNLTSVIIPESVTIIALMAFEGCGSLTSVAIPSGVTSIGTSAFSGCSSLTSVTIPSGVTIIRDHVFEGCNNLASATIPESVTSIGWNAFRWCSSLTSITIPSGVISIGDGAFSGCSSLTSVFIPSGVTILSEGVFGGCRSLTSITIPSGATSIGRQAFIGCSSLKNVTIPSGVTSIGEDAFKNCSGLTSVEIPSGVTRIGQGAFYECSSLTGVSIPSGVSSIWRNTFYGCSSLTSITIQNGVTLIDWYAFSGCSNLTSIIIPESVTSISAFAFRDCIVLQSVNFRGDAPTLHYTAFYNCANPFKVYYINGNAGFTNPWNGYNTEGYDELYKITFHSQGESDVETISANYNTKISAPIRAGYTVTDWYKDLSYTNVWTFDSDRVRGDLNIYGKWEIKNYSISYQMDGGTNSVLNPTSYTIETQEIALLQPTRLECNFAGWYDNPNFTGSAITTIPAGSTGDVTLYAKWIINQYTVNFDTQGGSAVSSISTDYNSNISAPTTPTKTGYTFAGWYKEATCINAWSFTTDKATTTTTLYAKWVPNAYTIAFNQNGGIGTLASIGVSYDVSTALSTNTFTKTGYSFAGWATSPTGNVVYLNQTDIINLTATNGGVVTLYAKWIPNTYSIKFNTNGGTGTMSSMVMTYDVSKALTTNVLKKSGYAFLGWSTTPTGIAIYADNASVRNLTSTSGATLTLYAKWGPPITSAVSYNYTSIRVAWLYAGNASSYRIYRATSAGGTYSWVYTATSTARSWVDTGQTTGKYYYYKVYPMVGTMAYTHSAYKYTRAIPTTPTVTVTKYSTTSIKVAWTGVAGATKYQVYRATSTSGTYSLVYTAYSTLRSWVNTGRTAGVTYYYKVRAYHLEGTAYVYGNYSTVKYLRM